MERGQGIGICRKCGDGMGLGVTGRVGADCRLGGVRCRPAIPIEQGDGRFRLERCRDARARGDQRRIVADHVGDEIGVKFGAALARQRRKPPTLDP